MPRSQKRRPDAAFAARILDVLEGTHPEARCALDYRNAFQLAVATILSAQCTDERVNMVTPRLFARFPDAASLARADPAELEDIIRSTGFFRAKAKSLIGMAVGTFLVGFFTDHVLGDPMRLGTSLILLICIVLGAAAVLFAQGRAGMRRIIEQRT